MELKTNAKVVVLEQLGKHRHHEGSTARRTDVLASAFELPPLKLDSGTDSVSWTASSLPYYIYSKKEVPTLLWKQICDERRRISECTIKAIEGRKQRIPTVLAQSNTTCLELSPLVPTVQHKRAREDAPQASKKYNRAKRRKESCGRPAQDKGMGLSMCT